MILEKKMDLKKQKMVGPTLLLVCGTLEVWKILFRSEIFEFYKMKSPMVIRIRIFFKKVLKI